MPEWQVRIRREQYEMAKRGEGTDMRVTCAEDEGGSTRDFPAHTVILMPVIRFFKSMGSYEYTNGIRGDLVCELDGVSASMFEHILEWIYTGWGSPTEENLYELMHTVNLLQIDHLWGICKKYLVLNPLHKDALRLCNELSGRIPEDYVNYIKDFRQWFARETADGQPHKEQLEEFMGGLPFRYGIQQWHEFDSWMKMRSGGDRGGDGGDGDGEIGDDGGSEDEGSEDEGSEDEGS